MLSQARTPSYTATSSSSSSALQQHIFSLLQNPETLTLTKLSQIHAQIILNGFSSKNFIVVKLLSFYITSGLLQYAIRTFEGIKNPSTSAWNQMIRGYGCNSMGDKSVESFKNMVKVETLADGYTYSYVLSGCIKSGLLREGEQVHARLLRNGYCFNVFIGTNLVNFYAVCGGESGIKCAHRVFDGMPVKNLRCWNTLLAGYVRCKEFDGARKVFDDMPERNAVSWSTMISGFAQNGNSRQAVSLFKEMQRARMELDQVVLIGALSACAELGDLELGKSIHSYIFENYCSRNQPVSVTLNNAVIHMYASCGMIDEAYELFRKMPKRNTASWTSIITGFAKQGLAEDALGVFHLMLNMEGNGVKPDDVTFIGVLGACSHGGYIDEGRCVFECMKNWGIEPRIHHYGCMVDLLSRAGYLEEALELIETMPMKPNDAIWGALLGGCRIHKNSKIASLVAQRLISQLDADQAAGYLMLLSDIYATAEEWKDVAAIRQKLVEIGAKKPSGRSRVQVNGTVHDFVAGDMTHRHASSIYELLSMLTVQAWHHGCESNEEDMIVHVAD